MGGVEKAASRASVAFTVDEVMAQRIAAAAEEEGFSVSSAGSTSYRTLQRSVDYTNLFIDVAVKGDFEDNKTIQTVEDTSASFTSIPVGSSIYVEATAYYQNGENRTNLFEGQSKSFKVHDGENQVIFVLHRTSGENGGNGGGEGGGGGSGGEGGGGSEPPAPIPNVLPDNKVFVANAEAGGAETNDGSEEHPLDSIEHAVEKINELIQGLIKGGNYTHDPNEYWAIVLLSDLYGPQKVPEKAVYYEENEYGELESKEKDILYNYLNLYIASKDSEDIKTIDGGFSNTEPTDSDSGTTLTIESYNCIVLQCVNITGGWAENGGGIKVSAKQLNIKPGVQIYGNKAMLNGAGIYAYTTSTESYNKVTVELQGGIIGGDAGQENYYTGNGSSGGCGGGVAAFGAGAEGVSGQAFVEFTMKSGSIKGNKALKGAGIYAAGKGGVGIEGGTVTNNTTAAFSSGCGGGIYANALKSSYGSSSVSIQGGSVTSNTAGTGGGIYSYMTNFSMTDGTVSGNTATSGIGTGLYFSKNTASVGLSLSENASFGANDYIYMADTTPAIITVDGYLANPAPVATLKLNNYTPGDTLLNVIGKGGVDSSTLAAVCSKFTIRPDSNGDEWYIKPGTNNDGKLSRVNPITYYVSQSGLDSNGGTNSSTDSLKTIKKAIEKISTHQDSTSEIEYVIKVVGMLTDEQSFNDAAAATFPSNIEKITIEGYNGLSAGVPQDGISVSGTTRPGLTIGFDNHLGQVVFKNFKITGSSGRGLDIGGYQTNPSCHVVLDEGTLITGNGNSNPGAGVNLASGCTLTMKDGAKITGNRTSGNGGGVMLNADTTLNMYGGEISGNVAGDNGGSGVGSGVYVGGSNADGDSSVVFQGNALINSNNDVYLRDISHSYIYIETSLNEDLVAKITPNTYHAGDQLIYTRSGGTGMFTPRMDYVYDKFAITDKADGSTWALNEDGELVQTSDGAINFYVKSDGSDSNDGLSADSALETLGAAFDKMNNASNNYVVNVVDMLWQSNLTDDYSQLDISTSVSANSIKIQSADSSQKEITGQYESEGPGTVLKVSTSVPVTIENILISSGVTDSSHLGGCLHIANGATVILGAGTRLQGGKTTGLGGGVYVANGASLVMKDDAVVQADEYSDVYLAGNAKITIGSALTGRTSDSIPYVAQITPEDSGSGYDMTKTYIAVANDSGTNLTANCAKFAVTPNGTTNYELDSNGKLQVVSGGGGTSGTWSTQFVDFQGMQAASSIQIPSSKELLYIKLTNSDSSFDYSSINLNTLSCSFVQYSKTKFKGESMSGVGEIQDASVLSNGSGILLTVSNGGALWGEDVWECTITNNIDVFTHENIATCYVTGSGNANGFVVFSNNDDVTDSNPVGVALANYVGTVDASKIKIVSVKSDGTETEVPLDDTTIAATLTVENHFYLYVLDVTYSPQNSSIKVYYNNNLIKTLPVQRGYTG